MKTALNRSTCVQEESPERRKLIDSKVLEQLICVLPDAGCSRGAIAGAMLAIAAAPASAGPASISFNDVAATSGLSAPVIKAGARVGRSHGLGIGLGLGTKIGIGTGHRNGLNVGIGADVGAKVGKSRRNGLDLGLGIGAKVKLGNSRKRRRW